MYYINRQKRRFKIGESQISDYDSRVKIAKKALLRSVPVVCLASVERDVIMDACKLMVC